MKKIPSNFPWESWEDFEDKLEEEWDHMKEEGLRKGILKKRKDGSLEGRGDPNKWFDAVSRK